MDYRHERLLRAACCMSESRGGVAPFAAVYAAVGTARRRSRRVFALDAVWQCSTLHCGASSAKYSRCCTREACRR